MNAVSIDGADVPRVGDVTALELCAAPECWYFAGLLLQVRVFAPTGQTRNILVR